MRLETLPQTTTIMFFEVEDEANTRQTKYVQFLLIIAGQSSTTQQPNDVTYEEVPGPIHYNDPCQPIPLENIEAYSVHKSAQMAETCSQEVDLKSNEAYGVRGEVQVAAINGTTDAVCYIVSLTRLVSNLEKQPVELKFKWTAMKHMAHLREIDKQRKLLTMITLSCK